MNLTDTVYVSVETVYILWMEQSKLSQEIKDDCLLF